MFVLTLVIKFKIFRAAEALAWLEVLEGVRHEVSLLVHPAGHVSLPLGDGPVRVERVTVRLGVGIDPVGCMFLALLL